MNFSRLMTVFVCGVFALVLGVSPAAAANDLEKAQQAFDQAQADYVAEKFDEASDGFLKAYAARPFPQFLYNAAADMLKKKLATLKYAISDGGSH